MSADQLEADFALWRAAVTKGSAVDAADADELESHLRDQVADLVAVGLSETEAFQIAMQRLGKVDQLTAEFAREHGERLWKQLDLSSAEPAASTDRRPFVQMLVFALIAALGIQVARILAGFPGNYSAAPQEWFFRNTGLYVLPVLAAYFAWRRGVRLRVWLIGAAFTALLAVLLNLYPFTSASETDYASGSQTEWLAGTHLIIVLWFVVGGAYLGAQRPASARLMDFVRFTGEWAIYWVLLALGGGVLVSLTMLVLGPLLPDAMDDVSLVMIPSGGAAAVIVAAWLVEAKKSVIENLAPVLTAIFTPLFAAMLLVAAVVYVVGGVGFEFDRNLLTGLDVLLVVVLALVLYALSARDSTKPAGALDAIRLAAVAAALLVDVLVLGSMFARIAEFGFTPNRVAALGLNLILVVNLAWTAWLSGRMLAKRGSGVALERWQTSYLPVFGVWAAVIVLVLPVVFAFQ